MNKNADDDFKTTTMISCLRGKLYITGNIGTFWDTVISVERDNNILSVSLAQGDFEELYRTINLLKAELDAFLLPGKLIAEAAKKELQEKKDE